MTLLHHCAEKPSLKKAIRLQNIYGCNHNKADSYHDYSRGSLIAAENNKTYLPMQNDQIVVDDLIAEIVDSKSIYHEIAVETLKRLCSQSCEAYGHLQDRVLDPRLPEDTQRQLGDMLTTVRTRLYVCQHCEKMCQIMPQRKNDTLDYVLRRHCVPKIC